MHNLIYTYIPFVNNNEEYTFYKLCIFWVFENTSVFILLFHCFYIVLYGFYMVWFLYYQLRGKALSVPAFWWMPESVLRCNGIFTISSPLHLPLNFIWHITHLIWCTRELCIMRLSISLKWRLKRKLRTFFLKKYC